MIVHVLVPKDRHALHVRANLNNKNATAGNRTRVSRVAGENSTTRPRLLCLFRHAMENPGFDPGTSRMLSGRSTN